MILSLWLEDNKFPELVSTSFLVKACPHCYENEMHLLSVSPNGRSIAYQCATCKKRQRAAAANPNAQMAAELFKELESRLRLQPPQTSRMSRVEERKYWRRIKQLGKYWPDWPIEEKMKWSKFPVTFTVPQDPLPYEQTVRGTITEAIRSEVWRRDGARCTTCGSNQNLQFDHIIPVAKGGATVVDNLQLLCQSCNLAKGAKI